MMSTIHDNFTEGQGVVKHGEIELIQLDEFIQIDQFIQATGVNIRHILTVQATEGPRQPH